MITVLSGGVGAARYLAGQVRVTPPERVAAVVNVADDVTLHGLRVSPDLDTIVYTLAGLVNPSTGWGRADETWNALGELRACGLDAWFALGDRDLGTHLFRTSLLAQGLRLGEITARIAAARGLRCRVLPVSDDPIETRVTLAAGEGGGAEVGFQEYFVKLGHDVAVSKVRFDGIEAARPGPGVLEAIESADVVVIAPSNPVVSIEPVLAVPGIREAVAARRGGNVAVSPIVAGAALKGPTARLLRELGSSADVASIARLYRDLVSALVIDEADAARAGAVAAEGVRPVVAPAVMSSPEAAAALARRTVAAVSDGAGR